MSRRKRRRYDDKFRATAVVMLEAHGYPDQKGALSKVSRLCDNVPLSTLAGWFKAKHNPVPTDVRNEKRLELTVLLDESIRDGIGYLPDKWPEATAKEIATSVAIFIDKQQLLSGKPTDRQEVNLKDGRSAVLERAKTVPGVDVSPAKNGANREPA